MSDLEETLRRLEQYKRKDAERSDTARKDFAKWQAESAARHAEIDQKLQRLKELQDSRVRTIHVNKRTHRLRFEGETEDEVTIVIEPKENRDDER